MFQKILKKIKRKPHPNPYPKEKGLKPFYRSKSSPLERIIT
jgi:hypothetical protein